jgi:Putative prokaryotic signal transducing protein
MEICPNCGMGSEGKDFCLECGVKMAPSAPEEVSESGPDRELRTMAVYKAPDEITAITLQKVLESEGIPAFIQSVQLPWYDGIMKMVEGYWGKVVVFEDQEEEARRVIEDYFRNLGPGLH